MKNVIVSVLPGYNYSFSVREDIFPYLYNRWHYHPEVELTLIRKGTGIRWVGDSVEQFEDSDLVLIGSNLPHYWRRDAKFFEDAFLLEVRSGYGCILLIDDKMSVARICYDCGFNNLSNFNRHFKNTVGLTPLKYSKTYLQDKTR